MVELRDLAICSKEKEEEFLIGMDWDELSLSSEQTKLAGSMWVPYLSKTSPSSPLHQTNRAWIDRFRSGLAHFTPLREDMVGAINVISRQIVN